PKTAHSSLRSSHTILGKISLSVSPSSARVRRRRRILDFRYLLVRSETRQSVMMEKNAKIYVAGHRGMVGSAIVRELERQGYTNIITRTHKELDLCRQDAVEAFFAEEKPEYVFLAAAKVGGIVANNEALADFMYDNMILEMNVIHAAWQNGCK